MLNYYDFSTHHFHIDPCNEQHLSLDLCPRCTIGRRGIPIFYKPIHYCLHKVSHCLVQIHFHFRKNMLLHLDQFNVTIRMTNIVIKYKSIKHKQMFTFTFIACIAIVPVSILILNPASAA